MTTAAVIGLSAGKRLLASSFYYSDINDKLLYINDSQYNSHFSITKHVVVAKKTNIRPPGLPSSSNRDTHSIKAVKEHVNTASVELWVEDSDQLEEDKFELGLDHSVDALLLLQKSMLEKQWNLTFEGSFSSEIPDKKLQKEIPTVTCSGLSARQRRMNNRTKISDQKKTNGVSKQLKKVISPQLLQNHTKGYLKGTVTNQLLTHSEVVHLSRIIRAGLSLEEHKSRLKNRLGCEPSNEQLAASLRITRTELQAKVIECTLAREKLAMSNVRLVLSIAQKYDNMGAEIADLIQGGLIGLLRGIEKFDSSKGFKISTYVYWWIRQGVSRTLAENSRTLRLPNHLHERLGLIRNAKIRLQEKGITPSIDKIAESLNMSQKKVRNATQAVSKVYSLDRDAFPSLNGLPGETHHSYIADHHVENIPWHGIDKWALKGEVNKLINTTLRKRERDIIRLYYGLDNNDCLTWEDISKRVGLSRERSRQVGLVALEKLKLAARKKKMEAMLVEH
ncbi:hypothetical protein ACFE04_028767 [Oxalis oulophora]